MHAGSTPVASKGTYSNSGGAGVDNTNLVPQQPPGALGHIFPLEVPMGGEAALSGGRRKKLLTPSIVRSPRPENLILPMLLKPLATKSLERLLF